MTLDGVINLADLTGQGARPTTVSVPAPPTLSIRRQRSSNAYIRRIEGLTRWNAVSLITPRRVAEELRAQIA
jgi:hypothetical protein